MPDLNQVPSQQTSIQVSSPPQAVTPPQQVGRIVQPPEISGNKEHEPISQAKFESTKSVEAQPEIAPSTPEIQIPPELAKTIEKSPAAQEPKIKKDIPEVKLAKESTPVITSPSGAIRLPMTYAQALQKEKSSSFWDGVHWFAAQIIYQWRKNNLDSIKK
jgi:hypothetical protein